MQQDKQQTTTLMSAVTTVSTGTAIGVPGVYRVVRAKVTGSGAVSASVDIYGTAGGDNTTTLGTLIGTIALTGTTSDADSLVVNAQYPEMFANVTAISGTSAAVTVTVFS